MGLKHGILRAFVLVILLNITVQSFLIGWLFIESVCGVLLAEYGAAKCSKGFN